MTFGEKGPAVVDTSLLIFPNFVFEYCRVLVSFEGAFAAGRIRNLRVGGFGEVHTFYHRFRVVVLGFPCTFAETEEIVVRSRQSLE